MQRKTREERKEIQKKKRDKFLNYKENPFTPIEPGTISPNQAGYFEAASIAMSVYKNPINEDFFSLNPIWIHIRSGKRKLAICLTDLNVDELSKFQELMNYAFEIAKIESEQADEAAASFVKKGTRYVRLYRRLPIFHINERDGEEYDPRISSRFKRTRKVHDGKQEEELSDNGPLSDFSDGAGSDDEGISQRGSADMEPDDDQPQD